MLDGGLNLEEPKIGQVTARIRSGITSGHYRPGLRLPTFAELEDTFDVGRAVIQRALEELKRDGFVRSEGRRGLYVTDAPPHLFQYGIVMPYLPGESGWSHLMTALSNVAHQIEHSDSRKRFRFYYGVKEDGPSERTLAQLRLDLDAQRIAGLMIHRASGSMVAEVRRVSPPVPHVHLWAGESSGLDAPWLTVHGEPLLGRSLELLKQRGRKRVAMMHMAGTSTDTDHAAMYAEVGMEYRAPWIQWVGRSDPDTAEKIVALLMDYPAGERPDGLVIGDDNLVPYVSSGLVSAGVRVGEELEMVAHCNWPWPPRSVLPMTRIGFDIREVMTRALATLEMQQNGETPQAYQRIEPQFEWEMQPASDRLYLNRGESAAVAAGSPT